MSSILNKATRSGSTLGAVSTLGLLFFELLLNEGRGCRLKSGDVDGGMVGSKRLLAEPGPGIALAGEMIGEVVLAVSRLEIVKTLTKQAVFNTNMMMPLRKGKSCRRL
jgi:hypothetical protein